MARRRGQSRKVIEGKLWLVTYMTGSSSPAVATAQAACQRRPCSIFIDCSHKFWDQPLSLANSVPPLLRRCRRHQRFAVPTQILDDAQLLALFAHLRGRPLYMPVLLAASTGMRRGEVLALKWTDVDLDRAELQVRQVVELVGRKMSLKEPKTDRSRRTITLPDRLVQELRIYRKEQWEICFKLGVGKFPLVFPTWDGKLWNPSHFTKAFSREIEAAKLPHVTFHGLRHTHITHLLRSGVPVHVVSARAGHANPTVTLNIYAHLLPSQQEGAAAIVDAALRQALSE